MASMLCWYCWLHHWFCWIPCYCWCPCYCCCYWHCLGLGWSWLPYTLVDVLTIRMKNFWIKSCCYLTDQTKFEYNFSLVFWRGKTSSLKNFGWCLDQVNQGYCNVWGKSLVFFSAAAMWAKAIPEDYMSFSFNIFGAPVAYFLLFAVISGLLQGTFAAVIKRRLNCMTDGLG